jgi:hypothetical protein
MRVHIFVDMSSGDGCHTTDDQIQQEALRSLAPGLFRYGLDGVFADLSDIITDLGGDFFCAEAEEASLFAD